MSGNPFSRDPNYRIYTLFVIKKLKVLDGISIEAKKQKEIDKLINEWPEEGIRLEKARWGRFNLIKGKTKVELPKSTKAEKITLEEAKELLEKKAPKKKTTRKKKSTAKKK